MPFFEELPRGMSAAKTRKLTTGRKAPKPESLSPDRKSVRRSYNGPDRNSWTVIRFNAYSGKMEFVTYTRILRKRTERRGASPNEIKKYIKKFGNK